MKKQTFLLSVIKILEKKREQKMWKLLVGILNWATSAYTITQKYPVPQKAKKSKIQKDYL